MPERIRCCVPHCSRTHRNVEGFDEWICQRHWSLVPQQLRRVHNRIRRLRRNGSPVSTKRAGHIWERCKRIAIEKGMGL